MYLTSRQQHVTGDSHYIPSLHKNWSVFRTCRHIILLACVALCTAPSSSPGNFVAMPTDPRSVVLTWDPPPPEDRNGPIVGYVINVTVIATGEMFQLTSSTNTLSVASLKPFTRYVCIIAARTQVGLGPFSTTVTVMTPEDGKTLFFNIVGWYCLS